MFLAFFSTALRAVLKVPLFTILLRHQPFASDLTLRVIDVNKEDVPGRNRKTCTLLHKQATCLQQPSTPVEVHIHWPYPRGRNHVIISPPRPCWTQQTGLLDSSSDRCDVGCSLSQWFCCGRVSAYDSTSLPHCQLQVNVEFLIQCLRTPLQDFQGKQVARLVIGQAAKLCLSIPPTPHPHPDFFFLLIFLLTGRPKLVLNWHLQ